MSGTQSETRPYTNPGIQSDANPDIKPDTQPDTQLGTRLDTSADHRSSTQSALSTAGTPSNDITSQASHDSFETPASISEAPSSPPRRSRSPVSEYEDEEETFAEKYASRGGSYGYVRLSCQIIDRYIRWGTVDGNAPTKVEADAKYMKMLDLSCQKQIREIIETTAWPAANRFIGAVNREREGAVGEKDAEVAIELWEDFERRYPRSIFPRSVSGASSSRSVSSASSNNSTNWPFAEDPKQETEVRGSRAVPLRQRLQKPPESDQLLMIPRRRPSVRKRSRLGW